ncbi:MAG: 1-phosphofructokinase [Cyclobacteriaceae bacterium]|nr:1-phosphofructokinase [Cyclobacteriaceae bacterium]
MLLAICPNPSVDTFVWVESLEPGKVHRANGEKRYPGGKGVHVALAASELGEEVTLLGFWGGETGNWIKNECLKRNIQCVGPGLNDWSRSCFTFKSEGIYDDTELLGTGPEITLADYQEFIKNFNHYLEKADVITMSGSWPKGAPAGGYAEMIRAAKKKDKPVFLDATGDHFNLGLRERPYAIHLNISEGRSYTGLSEINDVVEYFKEYVDLVAITSGEEGLYMNVGDIILHGKVSLEKFYSAVGSGDCLMAGLAVGLANKMDAKEMLMLGVACGGANCLRKDLGMLYQHDVKMLLPKVEVNLK